MKRLQTVSAWLMLLFFFSSCLAHKELINFSSGEALAVGTAQHAIRLQSDDLLDIRVMNGQALDPATVQAFNLGQATESGSGQTDAVYRIDGSGQIQFPGIGRMTLAGLTLDAARDTLINRLRQYLSEPLVHLRLLNFKVTVLGEVRNPNTFSVPGGRINILEALGMAGDLTNYGRRDKVLVIREEKGIRQFGILNLKDKSIFSSPFFQLQQHDIVYVEPLKQKTGAVSDQTAKILPWVSIGSIVLNILILSSR